MIHIYSRTFAIYSSIAFDSECLTNPVISQLCFIFVFKDLQYQPLTLNSLFIFELGGNDMLSKKNALPIPLFFLFFKYEGLEKGIVVVFQKVPPRYQQSRLCFFSYLVLFSLFSHLLCCPSMVSLMSQDLS